MKKLLLAFMCIAFVAGSAMAQTDETTAPKQIFGIRAGVNISKLTQTFDLDDDLFNKFGVGFQVGGSYEIAISKTRKWYFQTGLNIAYKTTKRDVDHSTMYAGAGDYSLYDEKYKSLYLEIPAMITRKIQINNDFQLQPAIGASYEFGLMGKLKRETERYNNNILEETTTHDIKVFDDANWTRSVINVKIAIYAAYTNYLFGPSITYGLNGDLWSIGIGVGYNF